MSVGYPIRRERAGAVLSKQYEYQYAVELSGGMTMTDHKISIPGWCLHIHNIVLITLGLILINICSD